VQGSTITTTATVTASGRLILTSLIRNGQALASAARKQGCKRGLVLVNSHGKKRCVSDPFGSTTLTVHAAGRSTVKVTANADVARACQSVLG